MLTHRFRSFVRGLGALALPLALFSCGGDGVLNMEQTTGADKSAIVSVRTAEVREETAPETITAAGVVEPIRRAMPASRLMGTVTAAPFDEGDRVRAGQVLVRIDMQDLAARRAQALAQVREAETVLGDAQTNLVRMRALREEEAIARVQLEQAETGVARAHSAVETARAAVRELEANAAYGTIEAPFGGVVVRKMVAAGNLAAPGQPLFVIEDVSRVRVVAGIAEDVASRLRGGERVRVEIAEQSYEAHGVVEAVLPSGEPTARGFRINVLLENRDLFLKSGMTVAVHVPSVPGDARPLLSVPAEAVVRRGQMTGVYVLDEDVARLRWISLGEAEGNRIRVLSGLRAGERVVVGRERERLQDGQRVAATSEMVS